MILTAQAVNEAVERGRGLMANVWTDAARIASAKSRAAHHTELADRYAKAFEKTTIAHRASAVAWESGKIPDHRAAIHAHVSAAMTGSYRDDSLPAAHWGYAEQHMDEVKRLKGGAQ